MVGFSNYQLGGWVVQNFITVYFTVYIEIQIIKLLYINSFFI